jgi:hypothetical protein
MSAQGAERLARLIVELQPYRDEIVFVGGWVHTLYLAEANERGGVGTEDIDIALPPALPSRGRRTLLELAERAGFERDPVSDLDGASTWMVYANEAGETVPIDFLTEGQPRTAIAIDGQPGLSAQGYHGQRVLLENNRLMRVGRLLSPALTATVEIRVPTLGAYLLQKGVSAGSRLHRLKRAKDLVYVLEIVSHPILGSRALSELCSTAKKYPREAAEFRRAIAEALAAFGTLEDVVEQMMLAGGRVGDATELTARQRAWLRRLLDEVR